MGYGGPEDDSATNMPSKKLVVPDEPSFKFGANKKSPEPEFNFKFGQNKKSVKIADDEHSSPTQQ